MKFFRNVFSTFATEVLIVGLNLLGGVLVARLLPPAERGILALVMLLPITLAHFADPGISQSIIYQLGRQKRRLESVAGSALLFAALFGASAVAIVWLLRGWLLETVLGDVPLWAFTVVLGLLPLLLVDTYLLSILRARLQFDRFNLRRLFTPLMLLIGVLAFVVAAGRGLQGAVAAFVLSTLLSFVLTLILVGRKTLNRLAFDRKIAGEALRFGVKSYTQNLVGHLHYRLDIYLLALFLPPEQVAFYTVATSVAEVVFYIPDSVGTVLFPRLSVETEERIHALTAEVARHTLFVSGLAGLGLAGVGSLLIPVFYGPEYQAAVLPFIVLLPGVLAMAVYKVLTRNFTSRNRQQVSIVAAGATLVVNVVLNVIFIPQMEMMGAALASLLSYGLAAIILLAAFVRETGIPLRQVLLVNRMDLDRYREIVQKLRLRRRTAGGKDEGGERLGLSEGVKISSGE